MVNESLNKSKKEIKNFLEMNENANTIYQICWMKQKLSSEIFKALSAYVKKGKNPQIQYQ